MIKPVTRYLCHKCDNSHADEYDASSCCAPEETTEYECSCGEIHEEFEKAVACCPQQCPRCNSEIKLDESACNESSIMQCKQCDWQTGDPLPPTTQELEAAGQQQLF